MEAWRAVAVLDGGGACCSRAARGAGDGLDGGFGAEVVGGALLARCVCLRALERAGRARLAMLRVVLRRGFWAGETRLRIASAALAGAHVGAAGCESARVRGAARAASIVKRGLEEADGTQRARRSVRSTRVLIARRADAVERAAGVEEREGAGASGTGGALEAVMVEVEASSAGDAGEGRVGLVGVRVDACGFVGARRRRRWSRRHALRGRGRTRRGGGALRTSSASSEAETTRTLIGASRAARIARSICYTVTIVFALELVIRKAICVVWAYPICILDANSCAVEVGRAVLRVGGCEHAEQEGAEEGAGHAGHAGHAWAHVNRQMQALGYVLIYSCSKLTLWLYSQARRARAAPAPARKAWRPLTCCESL